MTLRLCLMGCLGEGGSGVVYAVGATLCAQLDNFCFLSVGIGFGPEGGGVPLIHLQICAYDCLHLLRLHLPLKTCIAGKHPSPFWSTGQNTAPKASPLCTAVLKSRKKETAGLCLRQSQGSYPAQTQMQRVARISTAGTGLLRPHQRSKNDGVQRGRGLKEQ